MERERLSLAGIPLKDVVVSILGQEFSLLTLSDLDGVYHHLVQRARSTVEGKPKKLSSTQSDLCPHFGVIWPAALVLARAVASIAEGGLVPQVQPDEEVCLELGAGLGLPSFVLAKLTGRRVRATDRHPLARELMEVNAQRNDIATVQFEQLDFRCDLSGRSWPMIVGSDILYEPWQPGYLAQILSTSLAPGGLAIITDPMRRYRSLFKELSIASGLAVRESSEDGVTIFVVSSLNAAQQATLMPVRSEKPLQA
jgi:predicted nicotinamide N-methyase